MKIKIGKFKTRARLTKELSRKITNKNNSELCINKQISLSKNYNVLLGNYYIK